MLHNFSQLSHWKQENKTKRTTSDTKLISPRILTLVAVTTKAKVTFMYRNTKY